MPVLLKEVIDGLKIIPSGIYVDCTFGGGGHSKKILEKLNGEGKLIVFDQDEDARKNVPDDKRVIFVPHNFRHLQRFLRFHKIQKVNGILADLGVSSHQFNEAERGFSTRFNAALDMRMNQNEKITAADVIKNFSEEKLHKIFEKYGEVTNSKTLAKTIVEVRKTQSLNTINEFKNAVYPIVKGNPEKYFAQVFQAIRIEVNDELDALKEMLAQASEVLDESGRIAVITFHSLEDRVVKDFGRTLARDYVVVGEVDVPELRKPAQPKLKLVNRKAIQPTQEEIEGNPRSRSAQLRVFEKI